MSTIRKAFSAFTAIALSLALLPLGASTAFAIAPDSPQPHIPTSDGPADCVPYVGDPVKGYGQYPLGLRAPDFGTDGYQKLPVVPKKLQRKLPTRVDLRDNTQGFNDRVEVALHDGNLFVRLKDQKQWRAAPVPSCLHGTLKGISINEDALIGVDAAGWIYTMSNLLSSPSKWGWIRAFGGPFWFGDGLQSPNIAPGKWVLSLIGNRTDKTYLDPSGKQQPVSLAKCTQVVVLSKDGARIYSLDPWLAQDYSYEVGTPYNSRFIVESISASGSVIFITNKYGDMFVRQSDFDVNGSDPAQFRYTWQHDNRPAADNALQHRLDSSTAAIALPPRDWRQLPKIPGTITNRISIHSTAPGSQHRELRVEGKKDGHTGYWNRTLTGKQWHFTRTNMPLKGKVLDNSARDRSRETLRAPSPYNYAGALTDGATMRVSEFPYASVTRPVRVTIGRKHYTLLLHTVDGRLGTPLTMRLLPVTGQFGARPAGLVADVKRNYVAAFEVPAAVWKEAQSDPHLAAFIKNYLQGQRIHEVFLRVTTKQMEIINSPIEGVAAPVVSDVATLRAY